MSALAKNTSSKSSSKKSTSSKSTSKDNGASPKNAKGKTSVKAKAKFAGSLATAVKPTPPHQPTKPKQAPKPKKKDQGVPESPVMGQAAASPEGASAAATGPGATGAKQGAGKGAKSETSKAAKKVNTQKPSKIIKAYKGLGKNVTASKKKDEAKAHDAIPDYHAVMPGDAAMEAEGKKQNPKADTKVDDKVPGAEGKAPKIEKQKKGKSKRQKVDSKSAAEMKRLAAIENALDAMKSMLASMTAGISTDSNVNTDPGPAPEIVFSGSSNPQRAEKADAEADTKINEGHEKFVKAIDDGKQPSDVKRQEMDEVIKAVKQSDLKIGEEQLAAGEKYYEKLIKEHTTKEIDNADGILDPDIQGQMAKANKDMDKSLEKQETDRQAALDKAKADIDSQNQKAKDEQESIVDKAKKDIAKQQKDTRKKQDEEVKKAKKKGDKEKKKVEKDIADKEQKDEKKIEGEYTKAEKKAEAEEKKAEKKAQRKKREAEKKKKEQSWWERAKSAVSSFVDSVCSAIGDIFDALSSLVSGILNAVKDLACAIIDEAIKWAKKALDGLGSLLKGLVNGLIGDIFPGLAKALNEGIDAGIDLAKKGVDTVGEKLKEGVTAAIDTVNATVQKGLQVAKVGLQTAVRVTGCIATGDFEGAFLATFYGALEIAGVSRSDADKMLGNAKETIKLVVDDFGGFAGNLIGAAGDGFANFGKNFLSHFTGAVTDWLLGPVAAAGLKAPEKWDAQGIFGMVLGVLGVSTDSLKEMATERIGEDNMAALEKAFEYVTAFIDGGFAGLWEQAKSDLGNIWDLVLGMITDYISQKVVQFGMEQLASLMAGPFGALYQALKTAWGIYQTVRDKISEIKEVLTAIFSSVGDIARGNTKKASDWVENALAKVLGIAIDLGANLAGIGDIPDKIRGFVEGLQERVKTAIGKAMDWVLEKVKGLFAGGKDEKKDDKSAQDEVAPEPPRTLPEDQPIAWQGGLITLTWSQKPSILLNVEGKYAGVSSKSIDAMIADVNKTPDTKDRSTALKKLKAAKGSAASAMSKAGKWIQTGEGSKEALNKQTGDIAALILDGLVPLDKVVDATKKQGPDQIKDHGIGAVVPFKGGGEAHKVFIDVKGKDAQVMVASTPKPGKQRLDEAQADANKPANASKKDDAEKLIKQGRKLLATADREADAAAAGTGPVAAPIGEEKSLADVFARLFDLFASTGQKDERDKIKVALSSTADADKVAVFLAQDGVTEAQVKAMGDKAAVAKGREKWLHAAGGDSPFLKEAAQAFGDTIALRKFGEMDREHQAGAIKKFPTFYREYRKLFMPMLSTAKDAMFKLQAKAAAKYKGLGESDPLKKDWKTMLRVMGATDFYKYGLRKGVKDNLAAKHGIAPTAYDPGNISGGNDEIVYAEWTNQASKGKDVDLGQVNKNAAATFPRKGWWSPSKDLYMEKSAKGKIQGIDDFKALCEGGALAPEWYPGGFIQLEIDTSKVVFVRPTVFDGMLSPYWVQQPPSMYAATGGGAIEFISKSTVKYGDLKRLTAHIVTKNLQKALENQTANLNEHSEDTSKAHTGPNKSDKKVGEIQKSVGDKTNAMRVNNEADLKAETTDASNLLEHLQVHDGVGKKIDGSLSAALKGANAPRHSVRMPKTLDAVYAARPSLKSLFDSHSAVGQSLLASLRTITVTANLPGGQTDKRDFDGKDNPYLKSIRTAVSKGELSRSVRDAAVGQKVLNYKTPKLGNDQKTAIRNWLKKQEGGSLAKDPTLEKDRIEFEKKLGTHAMRHPSSLAALKAMAKKCLGYLEAREKLQTRHSELTDTMDELLQKCGSPLKSVWAGRVGNTPDKAGKIKDILAGNGTLRQTACHVNNFVENVLGPDLMNKSTRAIEDLINKANLHGASIRKRRKQLHHEEGAVMPMPWESQPHGQVQGEQVTHVVTSGEVLITIASRYGVRVSDIQKWNGLSGTTIRVGQRLKVHTKIKGSDINSGHNDNVDVKEKGGTRNSTGRGEHVWSKRKKSDPGLDLSSEEKDDENNPRGKMFLPFAEGALAWDINEESDWVKEARKLSMPLAGGVSGTTNRMMNSAKMLKPGVPMSHVRLAALGYLLPINAHSFHEVMTSCRKYGLPYTDAQYKPLSPLNGADFAKLPPIP